MMMKRVFAKFTNQEYMKRLGEVNWEELISIDDLEEVAHKFQQLMLNVLDPICPVKRILVRKKYKPWKTKDLQRKEEELLNLKKEAAESEREEDQSKVE